MNINPRPKMANSRSEFVLYKVEGEGEHGRKPRQVWHAGANRPHKK